MVAAGTAVLVMQSPLNHGGGIEVGIDDDGSTAAAGPANQMDTEPR